VVAYLEEDSRNIWQSGRAAFLRSWSYVYPLAKRSAEVGGKFSVAPVPAGPARRASVLGGWYLGISKRTRHRNEAIEFLRYMLSRHVQTERAVNGGFMPPSRSLSHDPAVLRAIPFFASMSSDMPDVIIRRPASLVGAGYGRVSRAYAHGVHMILTGKVTPAEGASAIQADLVRLTGFADRPQQPRSGVQESR
jgi:ABC-type glycerol-3-phosphate transport system substrate-binding protein